MKKYLLLLTLMDDTLYHYIDPGFSHTEVQNYTLLVLIAPAHYTLAVVYQQKLMVWRKPGLLSELTQPGEVQEVLNFGYQNIIAGISPANYTLIPESLFKHEDVASIARYLDVSPQDTVFAQPLDADNCVVFKTTQTTTMPVGFDVSKTVFAATGWIQAIAGTQPSGYNLYININENQCDLVYFRQGKLLLVNTFECNSADELTYYSLFVAEQLKLNPVDVNIIVSGDITAEDARMKRLSTFFKTATLNDLQVLEIPGHLPKHQLLALSALTLCASLADA